MKYFHIWLCGLFFLSGCTEPAEEKATPTAITPKHAAIASAHPLATKAGMDILSQQGNAFDAAIAVASTLGVVEPYSAGIGGGGFWLLYLAEKNDYIFIDAREKAPNQATDTLFLNENSQFDAKKATNGALAAAIPGQAAAFAHISKKYGSLPLQTTLAAAIHYADNGFPSNPLYKKLANYHQSVLSQHQDTAAIFLPSADNNDGQTLIIQKDLANALTVLATQGHNGFYQGSIASKLVEGVRNAGGIWTRDDLANYKVVERTPIQFNYLDYTIISAPPPSAGGITLAIILNLLEGYPINDIDTVNRTHIMVEAMRLAYRERQKLGDPDFVDIPVDELISKQYANTLRHEIQIAKATPSLNIDQKSSAEGADTTHFSIIDKFGNRVSATLSINLSFGSGFVAPGTGVLLNNHMDDFSDLQGSANSFGLVGSAANAIAPNKRPLSSMSPTFVEHNDHVAILGTPGGSRIITMVLQGILEHTQGKHPKDWVSVKRFHHQYLPDKIQHETGTFLVDDKETLKKYGHQFFEINSKGVSYGNMQAILWDKKSNNIFAASDPRGIGEALVE